MRRADGVNKIYSDFYNNITPERVPSTRVITPYMIAEYGGINLKEMHYDYSILQEKAIEMASLVKSDGVPFLPISYIDPRPPKFYQLLGSQSFIMSEKGFVQHPEVVAMMEDEYQELISDPYEFMLNKALSRHFKNIDPSRPFDLWRSVFMANLALKQDEDALMPAFMELFMSGSYYEGPPMGSYGSTLTPTDFIADQLRGFSGFSTDVRRHKNKIIEATEHIMPFLFWHGLPANPHPEGAVVLPIHMPTYMRRKDFEDIWLPTFLKMAQQYAALGTRCWLGLGNDYTRYLDILQDFPAGTIMYLEKGDPKLLKEKLGHKHIISGLFPIEVLKYGTKQQTIDKVKEYLDILAPGGGYLFDIDRPPLLLSDINFENYIAMSQAVEEYGKYDNAGEPFGQKLNSEGYVFDENIMPKAKSKYLFDWDKFKTQNPFTPDSAKETFLDYDKAMMDFVMQLLI